MKRLVCISILTLCMFSALYAQDNQTCTVCKGTRVLNHNSCNGTGIIKCNAMNLFVHSYYPPVMEWVNDNGTGRVTSRGKTLTCNTCNGTGVSGSCSGCNATGKVRCHVCNPQPTVQNQAPQNVQPSYVPVTPPGGTYTPPPQQPRSCYKCNGAGYCPALGSYYANCLSGKVNCSICSGTGSTSGYGLERRICSACNGAGFKICSQCRGSGKCPICHGTGNQR